MPDGSPPMQPPRRRQTRKPAQKSTPAGAEKPLVDPLEAAAAEVYRVLMHSETPPGAKASLLREYRMVVAAIAARPKAKVTGIDQLAAQRKKRRAAQAG